MVNEKLVYGLCWFQPDQWERLIEISADSASLENSYSEWRSSAHQTYKNLCDSGAVVKKVNVNIEELLLWCNERAVPVDGKARSSYVSYLMGLKSSKSSR